MNNRHRYILVAIFMLLMFSVISCELFNQLTMDNEKTQLAFEGIENLSFISPSAGDPFELSGQEITVDSSKFAQLLHDTILNKIVYLNNGTRISIDKLSGTDMSDAIFTLEISGSKIPGRRAFFESRIDDGVNRTWTLNDKDFNWTMTF